MSRKKSEAPVDGSAALAELTDEQKEARRTARLLEKRMKFEKLANRRVPRAIKALRSVANLASKQSYEYTDGQAKDVVNIIIDELNALKAAFLRGEATEATEWRLPGT
jgi:hypothetical protein